MAIAKFLGTYSTRGMPEEYHHADKKKISKFYWFIWEDAVAKTYLMQKLSLGFDPEGKPRLLSPDLFKQAFSREPRVTLLPGIHPDVADYITPAFSSVKPQSTSGKEHLTEAESVVEDLDFVETLSLDGLALDRDLRAEYSKGVLRMKDKKTAEARQVFKRLAERSEGVTQSHKHAFTDFGRGLRKNKQYELAMDHFQRAVELDPDDSHANFNIARLLYEMGRYPKAKEYLQKALELEPDLQCAHLLIKLIREPRSRTDR